VLIMANETEYQKQQRIFSEKKTFIEDLRKDWVPICHGGGATVPRMVWDKAWIAYAKKHSGDERQYIRILNEGFYAEELDTLYPGWQAVDREMTELRAKNEVLESNATLIFSVLEKINEEAAIVLVYLDGQDALSRGGIAARDAILRIQGSIPKREG
jgi:hypothetical protein